MKAEEAWEEGDHASKVKVRKESFEEKAFAQSRNDELGGLLRAGTFELVTESILKGNPRIFGSRFF